jgi:hypothetical protein
MYPYMLQRKLLVLVDGFPYSHKVATLECNSLYILLCFVCYYYGMISTRSALLIVFTCLDESNLLGVAFYTKLLDPR